MHIIAATLGSLEHQLQHAARLVDAQVLAALVQVGLGLAQGRLDARLEAEVLADVEDGDGVAELQFAERFVELPFLDRGVPARGNGGPDRSEHFVVHAAHIDREVGEVRVVHPHARGALHGGQQRAHQRSHAFAAEMRVAVEV
eukprot:CAMPEP_0177764080 /NCGR_PEP_ID=MMETSP0491_2-20121128/7208_1 /TAXON_ID=63592 /ORGANISM="Tetraselmis chuii, Strain PLY429" /LENGTH=142 /DNA_ID=CAMNT_0019280219 /DNA_START=43 /DNA_END=471 /DNA_ORIENTATION=-